MEAMAGWVADTFVAELWDWLTLQEFPVNLFLVLLQSWESIILLRALGPDEHGIKKVVPSGKRAGECHANPISSDLLFSWSQERSSQEICP